MDDAYVKVLLGGQLNKKGKRKKMVRFIEEKIATTRNKALSWTSQHGAVFGNFVCIKMHFTGKDVLQTKQTKVNAWWPWPWS